MNQRVALKPKPRKKANAGTGFNIVKACQDPKLFQKWFANPDDWGPWMTFLKAAFGLKLNTKEQRIYNAHTGRTDQPKDRAKECYLIVGRRGGKSLVLSLIAVYLACFYDWKPHLVPGEKGTILLMAADKEQARTMFSYIRAFLHETRLLKSRVIRETAVLFELEGSVSIEIRTASYKTVRGYTIVAALCDEIAFWQSDDAANPDYEILNALRPGMMTIPGSMLLCASSPYARRGELWKAYKDYYGRSEPGMLVWKAASQEMHPNLDPNFLKRQYERDPLAADAEYGGNFRTDVDIVFPEELVDSCTDKGIYVRPYDSEHEYFAFVDPSGGSKDSFTLAIAHKEEDLRVLDYLAEVKPPFSPSQVVEEFCGTLKTYHLHAVTGDRYGGEFPRELFTQNDVTYNVCEMTKSELYSESIALFNSAHVNILEHSTLKFQLMGLDRRTGRAGRDIIDHSPNSHDDVANAAVGALVLLEPYDPLMMW